MQTFYQFLEANPPSLPPSGGPKDSMGTKGGSSPTPGKGSSSLPSGFGSGMPPGLGGGGPPIGLGGGGPPLGSPLGGVPMGGDTPQGATPANKVQKIQGVDVIKSLAKTLKSRQNKKDSL